ncbi:MAG TPA: PepSY-like domain-containing protein [Phycisphaerae bacterium]|nr:PepSY-like domain-containing protein [Phycisphaerae bacterium]
MKTKNHRRVGFVAGLLGVLGAAGLAAALDDEKVPLDQVPAAARRALEMQAGGAKFTEIEREVEHGVTVYEAEWMDHGTEHEASVSADGELLEVEENVPMDKAPAAVREAIGKHFGAGTKVVIEKTTVVYYEVEAKVDGKEKELYFSPTGRLHGEESDDGGDGDEVDDD